MTAVLQSTAYDNPKSTGIILFESAVPTISLYLHSAFSKKYGIMQKIFAQRKTIQPTKAIPHNHQREKERKR